MIDPAPINVYSVTLTVSTVISGQTQQTQKQLNVLSASLQEAATKAVAATPNSEARQCNLVCVVNIQ